VLPTRPPKLETGQERDVMTQSPLQTLNKSWKNKSGLISEVKALATDDLWNGRRLNDDKGLDSVSNKKLLRLFEILTRVKKEFGSRAKLIDAIADAQGRGKDGDYKKGLERFSTPQLFDLLTSAKRRSK
jgi:hypothetical protein